MADPSGNDVPGKDLRTVLVRSGEMNGCPGHALPGPRHGSPSCSHSVTAVNRVLVVQPSGDGDPGRHGDICRRSVSGEYGRWGRLCSVQIKSQGTTGELHPG